MSKMLAVLAVLALAAGPASADRAKRDAERAADIQAGEAQLAKLTQGLVPGKPLTCAPTERWTGSRNIDHVGILYELGSIKYLNRLDPDCANFQFDEIPVVVSHGSVCRGDFVRIVDSTGFARGSCALGDFIPYQKPKR